MRCQRCGNTKNLVDNGDGWVCRWEHGCEHRQLVHEATIRRLSEELKANDPEERYPCGHTLAEHEQAMGPFLSALYDSSWQRLKEMGYEA